MTAVQDLQRHDDRTDAPTPPPQRQMLKRWGVAILGVLLLIGGAAMLILPGPGILVIVAGLTVLAAEFIWAQDLLVVARGWGDRALAASAASPRSRAVTLLSELAMLGLGVAMMVVPAVAIPLWGLTSGALLVLSTLAEMGFRVWRHGRGSDPQPTGDRI